VLLYDLEVNNPSVKSACCVTEYTVTSRVVHLLRLHNEERNGLYSSPNIIRVIKSRRMRWAGHVASMGEERGAYRILVGRPEGRRPLGRPRRRWEDNIKMDFMKWDGGHGLDCYGSG
jgi:hypothetical protein